jgi:hypothetical protein
MRPFGICLAAVMGPVLLVGQAMNSAPQQDPKDMQIRIEDASTSKELQSPQLSTCSLDQILPRTAKRLQEFVSAVNRITATEVLVHERLDKNGKPTKRAKKKFNYVAMVKESKHGEVTIEEFRDGMSGNFGFPGEMATLGMPSLALAFHADHRDEFEMSCEGPLAWHKREVWAVHFRQRTDKPNRMCQIRTRDRAYPVPLMGTAMIDTKSYQILHMEADVEAPIPEIRLQKEHQVLEYGPVWFEKDNTTLWLPHEADIILESSGKCFHQRHTFSDFRLFAVDYGQQIGAPPQPPPDTGSASTNSSPR